MERIFNCLFRPAEMVQNIFSHSGAIGRNVTAVRRIDKFPRRYCPAEAGKRWRARVGGALIFEVFLLFSSCFLATNIARSKERLPGNVPCWHDACQGDRYVQEEPAPRCTGQTRLIH